MTIAMICVTKSKTGNYDFRACFHLKVKHRFLPRVRARAGFPRSVGHIRFYGAPFSHLFTELKISPNELKISSIELEISPIQLKISPNQLEISTNRPI